MLFPKLYAACCARVSPRVADSPTCSRQIMQQVMDFFTCNVTGNRDDERMQQHNALARAIVTAFYHAPHQSMRSREHLYYCFPDNFIVEHCGCKITFSLPGENNQGYPATIEVSKGDDTVTTEVDGNRYRSICTTLLLRRNFNLPSFTTFLTEEGRANLREVRFYHARLHDVSLTEVDLQEAVLQDTILSGSNLKGANLRNISAENVTLDGANLSKADLQGASVRSSSLCEVNLQEASLIQARLNQSHLEQANLRGACLEKAVLADVCLSCADLCASNLLNASLERADLREANLSGARLEKVFLSGAKLNGAILDDIPLATSLLALPSQWNADTLDVLLNHASPSESGSLLTMMDSIDAKYPQIKVKMARELIASLRYTDVSTVATVLLDVLSKAPWSAESDIFTWLCGISSARQSR